MVESIKELERICQKGHKEVWTARVFYRKISIYFTKLFLYTPISANSVSILSGIIGLPSILFFSFGDYYYPIVGAILLLFWMIFEYSDGQVARYRKNVSIKGDYLETVFGIVQSLAFVGISFGSYSRLGNLAFLLGFSIVISVHYYRELLWKKHFLTKSKRTKTFKSKIKKAGFDTLMKKFYDKFDFIFSAATTVLAVLFGSLFNLLHLVLLFYGIAFPVYILGIIVYRLYYGLEKSKSMF